MPTIGAMAKNCRICTGSFSLYAASHVVDLANWNKKSYCPTGRVALAEVCYTLLLITSLVELVARAILSILGLLLLQVIPKSCKKARRATYVATIGGVLLNFANVVNMASALFDNLYRCGRVKKYNAFSSAPTMERSVNAKFIELYRKLI